MQSQAATFRQSAQDALMQGMQAALSNMPDDTADDKQLHRLSVKQFRRVEKLFGYEPGSWLAGV